MNENQARNQRYRRPIGAASGIAPWIVTAVAAIWLTAGGSAFAAQEENQYQASRVQLQLRAGSLAISTWDREAISVTRTVRDPFGRASFDAYVENGTLFILSECTPHWMPPGRCRVDYRLKVPAATPVAGLSSNGVITIVGLRAPVALSTSDGCVALTDIVGSLAIGARNRPVTLTDVHGDIRVENEDGAVRIRDVVAAGTMEVSTSNAPIEIVNSVGSLILRNRNRAIEVAGTAAGQIDAVTTNASIVLNPNGAPERIFARTSNGDIEISIPEESPSYAVETKTTNGTSDVQGIIVDPGSPFTIRAETTNANIEIAVSANELRAERVASLPPAGAELQFYDQTGARCP